MSVISLLQRLARAHERGSDGEEENDQCDRKQIEHRSSFHKRVAGTSVGLRELLLTTPHF
jgi:hypothetical protein